MDVLCTFKTKKESQNSAYGLSETSDHSQIKIQIPQPHQELTKSSKAQNEDLMDMDVLCTFNIKRETQNLEYWYIKYQ